MSASVESVIRPARESDFESVSLAIQRWWTLPGFDTEAAARERAALVPRLWLQHFASTSLVAERDARLSGFLIGFLSPDHPRDGYIHFVGVAPDERRTSLGRALYKRFFVVCRNANRGFVRCVTTPTNTVSIAFHQHMGFEIEPGSLEVGNVRAKSDYDGPGVHRIAFIKAL